MLADNAETVLVSDDHDVLLMFVDKGQERIAHYSLLYNHTKSKCGADWMGVRLCHPPRNRQKIQRRQQGDSPHHFSCNVLSFGVAIDYLVCGTPSDSKQGVCDSRREWTPHRHRVWPPDCSSESRTLWTCVLHDQGLFETNNKILLNILLSLFYVGKRYSC